MLRSHKSEFIRVYFYDIPTEKTVHTSLWDIICTKKVPVKYSAEKLRQTIEELQLLREIEENAEFFDDERGHMLVVDSMDVLRRGNGEVGGVIIYATWHALEEGDVPCEETEVSIIAVKIGKYQAEKLIKNLEEKEGV